MHGLTLECSSIIPRDQGAVLIAFVALGLGLDSFYLVRAAD